MQDLEQVLSAKTEKEAALILADKGFDGNGTYTTPEALLTEETEKTKKLIEELQKVCVQVKVLGHFAMEKKNGRN